MKIMIVDDHRDMRSVLKNMIELSFAEAVDSFIECESGEEAVEQFREQHPDCVIMDFQMHNMTGFEATQKIMEMDGKAKIVIVTSYDSPSIKSKAEQLHVTGFVSKDNLSDIYHILQPII